MERQWERRSALPPLPLAAVAGALRSADVAGSVTEVEVLEGGLVNLNARVLMEAPRMQAVFRVYVRERDAAAKEAALLERVAGVVPAPRVLARGDIVLGETGDERPWLLLEHIDGRALEDAFSSLDDRGLERAGRDVGTVLARLHTQRTGALGFLDEQLGVPEPMGSLQDTWRGYLTEMLTEGRAGTRLGGARRDELLAYVDENVAQLAALEDRWCLLHADCKPVNVFVADDGALEGLIDWEFAWSGPALFDLGQMLRVPVPAAYEAGLVAGYMGAGGELPEAWRHKARLLDLMNLIGFLDQEGERPTQQADIRRLLEAYR